MKFYEDMKLPLPRENKTMSHNKEIVIPRKLRGPFPPQMPRFPPGAKAPTAARAPDSLTVAREEKTGCGWHGVGWYS